MYHPPDFNRVFRDGEIFKIVVSPPVREVTRRIELVSLGELYLPTGKIVAFDPSYSEFEVFDMSVLPGRYPVQLAMAHFDDEYKNVSVASAMIKFQEQEAVAWKVALLPKLNDDDSQPEDFYCYGVDAGLGCFADEQAAKMLVKRIENPDNYISFIDDLNQNSAILNQQCVNLILDTNTELNVCVFGSGYGDGCYSSYWGIGADGSIVSLATDFMLGDVDEKDEE